uniref:Uncharacterized protein n=1 Tax=Tetranychus urticae TaxID=32264 RepID=T1KQT1_TETUR
MEIKLEAVDNSLSDINYFKYEEIDDKTVAIKLAHSLEDLVDRRDPQSVLKFKLTCRGPSGTVSNYSNHFPLSSDNLSAQNLHHV